MVARSARAREQLALAASLRDAGRSWTEIAAALRDRYRLDARIAMRVAHGWTQAEVAQQWNSRWPDEPKTFKNISYWENWPSPTGHAPSLHVLDRLAQLYECDVADLLVGWGEHGTARAPTETEPETLAWQVGHLDLYQLTRAVDSWAARLPGDQRRALLLKLSTAAAVAAGRSSSAPPKALGRGPAPAELAGSWDSRYTFLSTGRGAEFEGTHHVVLRLENGRLIGSSDATSTGTLELELVTDGLLVTGNWTERTAPDGYYRGAVYHGIVQFVLDPTGRSMIGRWLGPDRHFAIDSGRWELHRAE
jgi:transcriptional regulator with XRE-family HTH domain